MEKIKIHDKVFRKFIPYEKLCTIFDEVAARLNSDFGPTATDEDPIVLVCVLNGSIMFMGELLKRLNFPLRIVSTKLTSYYGMDSCGEVSQSLGFTGVIEGARCIVVEDIVDTGKSIAKMKQLLSKASAREIYYCTLCFKPGKYQAAEKIDYCGIEIPDDFVVGFGLDYDELGRNLPDIYTLDI
ncbi:MAG: hypoxanthine phosphoribosyltransferase [Bacteroidales bacterium]|nr:hypoxanthine phosphoribosyltransferase [Bacteroidales bacterium]